MIQPYDLERSIARYSSLRVHHLLSVIEHVEIIWYFNPGISHPTHVAVFEIFRKQGFFERGIWWRGAPTSAAEVASGEMNSRSKVKFTCCDVD